MPYVFAAVYWRPVVSRLLQCRDDVFRELWSRLGRLCWTVRLDVGAYYAGQGLPQYELAGLFWQDRHAIKDSSDRGDRQRHNHRRLALLPRPLRPARAHPRALPAVSTVSASLVRPTLRPHADSALNSLGSSGPTRLALSCLALFSTSMRLLDRAGPASLGSGWARGTTAADFGRRTRRDGCVVKDSYDRIVRQNYRAALPDLTALLPWVRTSGWR